jgi:hypothetical protein
LVEREAVASPARLERAARQLGMQPMQAAQIDPLKRNATVSVEKSSPAPAAASSSPAKSEPVRVIRQPKPPTQPSSQQAKLIPARAR